MFLEALASPCRQYKTSSLWPWLLTDAISHTGSKSTRFQSHLCCDGNCSSLSHKSAPPFALQAKIYLYSHKRTHTNTQTNSRVTLPESKSTPSKFVSVLLFISFSLCSQMLELHYHNPPRVLHVPGLSVFSSALRAHSATNPYGQEFGHLPFGRFWSNNNFSLFVHYCFFIIVFSL